MTTSEWPANDPLLPAGWRPGGRLFADLFWMIPVSFYFFTACREVGWVDCANHVADTFLLGKGSWVNQHNLFFVLGRLWLLALPLESPAFALNLFSAACGAVTVAVMFRVGLQLTGNLLAATAGAIALMWSHSLWWHSTLVEVYTLNTALIAGMVWFVLQWTSSPGQRLPSLYAALLCLGLGISNHVLMILFVPAFLVLFAVEPSIRSWRVFGLGLLALVLGAQLWLGELQEDFVRSLNAGASWSEQTPDHVWSVGRSTLDRASGGRWKEVMTTSTISYATAWSWRARYAGLLAMNYPSVALPAALWGIWVLLRDRRRRVFAVFFTVGIGVQALWSANYRVWDMFAFGLPVWTLFAVPVMLGLDAGLRAAPRVRWGVIALLPTLAFAPVGYLVAARQTHGDGVLSQTYTGLGKNLYNAGEFRVNPNKRWFTQARDVIAAYALVLPANARLWDSESKGFFPFTRYYQRVLGGRPDVQARMIFGPGLDEVRAAKLALELHADLESGERVFVSSLEVPERLVLSQLHRQLAGDSAPPFDTLNQLGVDEFAAAFPRYRFHRVDLPDTDGAWIYEMLAR